MASPLQPRQKPGVGQAASALRAVSSCLLPPGDSLQGLTTRQQCRRDTSAHTPLTHPGTSQMHTHTVHPHGAMCVVSARKGGESSISTCILGPPMRQESTCWPPQAAEGRHSPSTRERQGSPRREEDSAERALQALSGLSPALLSGLAAAGSRLHLRTSSSRSCLDRFLSEQTQQRPTCLNV